MYCVSYFCAVGNPQKENQDRVLANGELLREGIRHRTNVEQLFCLVADGVGSMANSGNAAEYVLAGLREVSASPTAVSSEGMQDLLAEINARMVKLNREPGELEDSATTLSGVVCTQDGHRTINVGDSEVLVIKNRKLDRLTVPQVLDPEMPNSPITGYLGSRQAHMHPEWGLKDASLAEADTIIVTTDGLLKAISAYRLVEMLSTPESLAQRVENLYLLLCATPAPDNLGAIFIEAMPKDGL